MSLLAPHCPRCRGRMMLVCEPDGLGDCFAWLCINCSHRLLIGIVIAGRYLGAAALRADVDDEEPVEERRVS